MGLFGRKNQFDVNGKTVVLTGGSEGMGKCVGKILAAKGATIVIVSRNVEKLTSAIAEIKACANDSERQRFHYISADVSKAGEAARIVSEVTEWNQGPPDIVWCVAGAARPTLFIDSTPEQHRHMMDLNYWSCADMAHAILSQWLSPDLKSKEPRHLIFTSSVIAFCSMAGYGPYAPGKAAIRSLSDTLAQEVKLYASSSDVKIHTVFPGTIVTAGLEEENKTKPGITKVFEESDPKVSPEVIAENSVKALERGEYLITTGWMGSAMRACAWGGSTRNNWIVDSLWMAVTNFVWLFVQRDFDGKIIKYGKDHGHPSTYAEKKAAENSGEV